MTDAEGLKVGSHAISLIDPTLWYWYRQDHCLRQEIFSLFKLVVRVLSHVRQMSLNRQRNQVLLPIQSERGHLEEIFSYLDGLSLASASQACRTWREVEESSSRLWEELNLNTFNVSMAAVSAIDTGSEVGESEDGRAMAKLLFLKLWRSSRMVLRTNGAVSGLGGIKVNRYLLNFT